MREPGSEKKSKRNPDQISIERREFLKTAGVATAGMTTGVVPPSPAIAQERRGAPWLGAKGVDYIDIRDYGPVEDNGNITRALNAALAAFADSPQATIRIPYPLDGPGGDCAGAKRLAMHRLRHYWHLGKHGKSVGARHADASEPRYALVSRLYGRSRRGEF